MGTCSPTSDMTTSQALLALLVLGLVSKGDTYPSPGQQNAASSENAAAAPNNAAAAFAAFADAAAANHKETKKLLKEIIWTNERILTAMDEDTQELVKGLEKIYNKT